MNRQEAIDILTNKQHWDELEEIYEAEHIIRQELRTLEKYRSVVTSIRETNANLQDVPQLAAAYIAQLLLIEETR